MYAMVASLVWVWGPPDSGSGDDSLPVLGTLSSYWVASSNLNERGDAQSYCIALCYGWLIYTGGLHLSEENR